MSFDFYAFISEGKGDFGGPYTVLAIPLPSIINICKLSIDKFNSMVKVFNYK